jgi:hypothetical protein
MELLGPLVQTGAIGSILAWFMFRNEAQMKSLGEAMDRQRSAQDRQTRAVLLLLVSNPSIPLTTVAQAKSIVEEIDEADAQQKVRK